MNITIVICTIISIIIAFIIVYKPLILKKPVSYFQKSNTNRFYTESVGFLEMLKDLEADYKTGKISKQDFDDLALEYKHNYLKTKELEEG